MISAVSNQAAAGKAESAPGISPQLGVQWAQARLVYPIYSAMAAKFELGEACPDLESAAEHPKADQVLRARHWLDEMDEFIQVHQFRQFLQSAQYQNPSEESLRALIHRHLLRRKKTSADGEKIDFLLVQYFALRAAEGISGQEITLAAVAESLEPVLGPVEIQPLEWFGSLEELIHSLGECRGLRDLMETGVLEQGRQLKSEAGESFYDPTALVAFVRFNFLVRRAFIRLMNDDLRAIQDGLRDLAMRGERKVDCRAAGRSEEEPASELYKFCATWKQPFARNYSETTVSDSFGKLIAIRSAVEAALQRPHVEQGAKPPAAPQTAPAATAEAKSTQAAESAPTVQSKLEAALARLEQAQADTAPTPTPVAAENNPEPEVSNIAAPAAACDAGPVMAEKSAVEANAASPDPVSAAATDTKPAAALESPSAPGAQLPESSAAMADAEACMEKIWEQILASPPTRGRSMTSVTYQNTKMLLSSWEVAAFINDAGKIAEDLRHGVVARMLVAVAIDAIKHDGAFDGLEATLNVAAAEAAKLQECIEQAKKDADTEGAVNLSITAKRLQAYVDQAHGKRG